MIAFFKKRRPARPQKTGVANNALDADTIPWLLACALVTAAPHAGHLPLWLSLLGAAVWLGRLWLWHRHAALPKRWLLATLTLIGTFAIAYAHRTLFGRDAGVALLFFFMALKPMEIRNRRDALVLIMLGYFLLLTHYLFSETIPVGLWLLLSAVLLTATLIRLYGSRQPVTALLRQAGILLLQAAPFMLILFVLFPRIEGPLWGLPQDAHAGRTGLSNSMSPGSLSSLIQSGEIAFRVQFDTAPPDRRLLYWRGPVLIDYDGKTWHARPYATYAAHARRAGEAPEARVEAHGRLLRYTSTLEAHNQRWLLALDMPVELPENARLSRYFETTARRPISQRQRFSFVSATEFSANREERQATQKEALRLPADINPQARALAATWKAQMESPEQISAAALHMFRSEAFFYTLKSPLLGENAIDDFLFGSRRGFCEHYAAAYVFLMRAAGVPARIVAGYQGGEVNPLDGYLVVRQSDAHAWAEIWVAGKGWLRVDPTFAVAPSRIESGIAAALPENEALSGLARTDIGWLLRLRYRWEALNNAWDQWVLGYNALRQQELLTRLGFRQPDWQYMMTALTALCCATLLISVLWALRRRRLVSPAQRLWQRYCRRLHALGVEYADWEGPLALAERTARAAPPLAALTRQAAASYAELRYGPGGEGQSAHLVNLKRCLRQLERTQRHHATEP